MGRLGQAITSLHAALSVRTTATQQCIELAALSAPRRSALVRDTEYVANFVPTE